MECRQHECSQGVACTSNKSYTCKISNACVWGKIGCMYVGEGTGLCVCKMYYPRFYHTAKLRLTSMVFFRSTWVASLVDHSWLLELEVVELASLVGHSWLLELEVVELASLVDYSWLLELEVVELAVLRLELLIVFRVELLAALRRDRVVVPVATLELERGWPQVLGSSRLAPPTLHTFLGLQHHLLRLRTCDPSLLARIRYAHWVVVTRRPDHPTHPLPVPSANGPVGHGTS